MNHILEVKNLSKKYEKSGFLLDNVSFSVPYGSIMGFIGENGAGKTTTINCIINALFKDNGTVKIFGKEMFDKDTVMREDIGVVFDASNFSENLDVEQLSKVMQKIYSNWQNEQYIKLIEKFCIPFKKKIKSFSRGMTMKLSLAVALSHQAKLLILDEATSGLDPIARDEVLEAFLDFVQDENHAILLSSHITGDLEKIADYITFINKGQIVFSEKKDDLIYNYGVMRCKLSQFEELDKTCVIAYRKRDYQIDVLIKNKVEMARKHKEILMDTVSIDEIMLLMVKGE